MIAGLDEIPGLDFWYKFDQGSYHDDPGTALCTNGQTIHYARDFSGNGRHSLQPTDGVAMKYSSLGINSKGTTIEDLSTNRAFATLSYTRPSVFTCVAVQKINRFYATGNFYTLLELAGTNTIKLMGVGSSGGGGAGSVYPPGIHDSVNGFATLSTPIYETSDGLSSGPDIPHLVMWEVDCAGGTRRMWYDGILVMNVSGLSALTGGTTLEVGVGGSIGGSTYFFGAIGEMGLWPFKLSADQRSKVEAYMASAGRWNLSGITPGALAGAGSHARYC